MTTRYARCGELSIAWQTVGDGPIDLLVIPGLVSHVEAFHELPGYTRLLSQLISEILAAVPEEDRTPMRSRIEC